MSNLRKGIVHKLKKKIVELRGNPSHLIMLSVQDKLMDAGYSATAMYGLLAITEHKDGETHLTVFDLQQFPAMNFELYNIINETKKYAGVDGKKWGAFNTRPKIVLESEQYIPTRDEVTEFGYKHLTNEGNEDGKKYRHDDVVNEIYNKVLALL